MINRQSVTNQQVADDQRLTVPDHEQLFLQPAKMTFPVDFLNPYTSTIPYVPTDTMEILSRWLIQASETSIQCCAGHSGLGKTRLARELIQRALQHGFRAGFATLSKSLISSINEMIDRPCFIILDNLTLPQLVSLYDELTNCISKPRMNPLLILILERCQETPFSHIHYWLEQQEFINSQKCLKDLLVLKPLSSLEQRQKLLQNTLNKLDYQSTYYRDAKALLRSGHLDARLMQTNWAGSPLALTIAGLLTEHHGMQSLLSLDGANVFFEGAEYCINQLKQQQTEEGYITSDWFMHVLAYIHLTGEVSVAQLTAFLEEEQNELTANWQVDIQELSNILITLLGYKETLTTIKPLLIADAITYYVLQKMPLPNGVSKSLLRRVYRFYPHNALTVLLRIAQDLPSPKARHFLLTELDNLLTEHAEFIDEYLIILIIMELPISPADSSAINHTLYMQVLNRLFDAIEKIDIELTQQSTAIALEAFYKRLLSIDALPVTLLVLSSLTKVYIRLATVNELVILPKLASTLDVMGECLIKAEKFSNALASWQQAVDIYQDLNQRQPDKYQRSLAHLVERLAALYGQLGHMDESLRYASWGAELYVNLATIEADCLPDVVVALNQLAERLNDIGQSEAALKAISQAIVTAVELARNDPGHFHPLLLALLAEKNRYLFQLGQYEQALVVAKERASLLKGSATVQLAQEFSELRCAFTINEQWSHALDASKQALNIYVSINRHQIGPGLSELALELQAIAELLNKLDQAQTALTTLNEALLVAESLYQQDPKQTVHLWLSIHEALAKQCYVLHHAETGYKILEKALSKVVHHLEQNDELDRHQLSLIVDGYLTYSITDKHWPHMHLIRPVLKYLGQTIEDE